MLDSTDNPFTPGFGHPPPFLAGRDAESHVIQGLASGLANPKRQKKGMLPTPHGNAILTAPRGFGKTALMRSQLEVLRSKFNPQRLHVMYASASGLNSKQGLFRCTLGDESAAAESIQEGRRGMVETEVGVGALGVKAGRAGTSEESELRTLSGMTLIEWQEQWSKQCQETPSLLFIDEAHTIDLEVAYNFFNAVQMVQGERVPLSVVVAGTPDLQGHLDKANATFWDRVAPENILDLQALSKTESEAAIVKPLSGLGVEIESDAVARIVGDSQGYPHFLQAWGEGSFRAFMRGGGRRIAMNHLDECAESVERAKWNMYLARWEHMTINSHEIGGDSSILYGAIASGVLAAPGMRVPDGLMRRMTAGALAAIGARASGGDVSSALRLAHGAGLIRRRSSLVPDASNPSKMRMQVWWFPAIPSMLSYVRNAALEGNADPSVKSAILDAEQLGASASREPQGVRDGEEGPAGWR